MSNQPTIIRVSTIARITGIKSKYIVEVLDLVEPSKKHSASSRMDTSVDQQKFYITVIDFAVRKALLDKSELVLTRN